MDSCPVGISQVIRSSPQINSLAESPSRLSFLSNSNSSNRTNRIEVEIEFDRAETIASLDVGNHGSAFLEIMVRQSPEGEFINLLPSVTMMSPGDSRLGLRKTGRRRFGTTELSKSALKQKWHRVLIICRQPFKPSEPFGLSFLYFYTTDCTSPDFKPPSHSPQKSRSCTSPPVAHKENKASTKPSTQSPFSPEPRFPSLKAAASIPSSDVQKTTGKVGPSKRKRLSASAAKLGMTRKDCVSDDEDGIVMRSKVVKQKIETQERERLKPKSPFEAVYKALNDAQAADMMKGDSGSGMMDVSELKSRGESLDENVQLPSFSYCETLEKTGIKEKGKYAGDFLNSKTQHEHSDELQSIGSTGCYQRRSFLGLNGMSCVRDKGTVNFTDSYKDKEKDKGMLHNVMSRARSTEMRIERERERYATFGERKTTARVSHKLGKSTERRKVTRVGNGKAIHRKEMGAVAWGERACHPTSSGSKENKVDTPPDVRALSSSHDESEFEAETRRFVASLNFKTIDLDTVTFGDLRQQFEQQRGLLLSSKKQKRKFLSVVEKAVDDVMPSRSNTSPTTAVCGTVDADSPLPCPICGERFPVRLLAHHAAFCSSPSANYKPHVTRVL